MEARIEGGKLIVTIDLVTPRPSKSGKTIMVATSGGNKVTAAVVNGKNVTVGLNAYITP